MAKKFENLHPDKRYVPTSANFASSAFALTMFCLIAALLWISLPDQVLDPTSHVFLITIGFIGIWRYGWWFIHLIRAILYRAMTFRRLRKSAEIMHRCGHKPDHLYVLVTSYRMDPKVTYAVYASIIRNAVDYGVPTTVYASVSDRTDVDILTTVLEDHGSPDDVEFRYMFQRGDGKRSAMAEVLRAISRSNPGPNDLVAFVDGDIHLPTKTFRRSMPFFFVEDDVGAITTNNRAVVEGDSTTREWYDLRYAQRHLLMSSMSLSRRVLVLTGRYSVIRAPLCVERSFIELVEKDELNHPRFGTIRFLSGDDKSTWFWLLKNGWAMRYIPDVEVHGFEELPNKNKFFGSTLDLMRRWYGNMLRTSGRAIKLGPRPMGLFTWWCLVDQRMSIWTTLIGPTVALSVTLFIRPSFGLVYLLWVMGTRLLASVIVGLFSRRFNPMWPFLLYYNQIGGAFLKSYIAFRFNRQKWTRQGISAGEAADPRLARYVRTESALQHAVAVLLLITLVTTSAGVLAFPGWKSVQFLAAENFGETQSDDRWFHRSLNKAPTGGMVLAPAEEIDLSRLDLSKARAGTVSGAGADQTTIRITQAAAGTQVFKGDREVPLPGAVQCGVEAEACRLSSGLTMRNLTLQVERVE